MSDASLRGSGSNLADMGRYVVRVASVYMAASGLAEAIGGGQFCEKCCGVTQKTTGVKLGASLDDR